MPASPPPTTSPKLLFTAFEPSGDDHASAVIAELLRRHPELPIYAWGGPKMQAAGATIVEFTGEDAVMGMPGLKKIREHGRINERVGAWMREARPAVHIPVDSPGANFPLCKIAKREGIKVVHLVAPQIWAWGRWRIHKLRRLTDMVLCLLPFEERFFLKRGVQARFIGHPLFDPREGGDVGAPTAVAAGTSGGRHELWHGGGDAPRSQSGSQWHEFGDGSPRLALMPGSRPAELRKSFPLLLEAFRQLKRDYPKAMGIVAATKPAVAEKLEAMAREAGGLPEGLRIVASQTDAIIRWCDLALVKSGTITLQIAREVKPMVAFYKSGRLPYYLIGKWVVSTKFFTLPNLLAHREIVPEFVPHFGGAHEIVQAAKGLIDAPAKAQEQRDELARVIELFRDRNAAAAAADAIEEVAGIGRASAEAAE